jgi:eukaryotic-like serine/threonine-protein kinase
MRPAKKTINRNTVSGEALLILRSVRENARDGKSNKLSELKATFDGSVSLEFDTYFFFLRKHHYLALDHRDGQLKLTDAGDRVVEGEGLDKLADEAGEFFSDQLSGQERTEASVSAVAPPPPAPPPPNLRFRPSPEDNATRLGAGSILRKKSLLGGDRGDDGGDGGPHGHGRLEQLPKAPTAGGTDIDLRYVKFDVLGQGPMGTVFKGRHNALGTDICVKELKDIFGYFSFLQRGEVVKRLKKELCAQAQVRHPCVVAILDQNTDVARPYYVMEMLSGSLRQKLDAAGGKALPVKQVLRYFAQMAYGLRAAHATGLTHHNLKPENLLFDASGNVRIGDFGLARVIEVDATKGLPQVFVGTGGMAYLCPELLGRAKDAGPAADVYAIGILLYEMLTGQLPGRRSPLPSEVNPEVPKGLDALFDKMTHDRKESRYPDFDAVLADFYKGLPNSELGQVGDLLLWSTSSSSV